ncbi:MAG: biopolymer transporter ExbD [Calditrichaeota bacterium]|nr:biopolymer transporter ExbD [Calditrichota bacterium]
MPDIVFMLLIFFMVSTVFKESNGLNVVLPAAKRIEKLPGKRDVAVIWADRSGRISIDDKLIQIADIEPIIRAKARDELHPMKLVSLRIDKDVEMSKVTAIQQQLRTVGSTALNINYSTKTAVD